MLGQDSMGGTVAFLFIFSSHIYLLHTKQITSSGNKKKNQSINSINETKELSPFFLLEKAGFKRATSYHTQTVYCTVSQLDCKAAAG